MKNVLYAIRILNKFGYQAIIPSFDNDNLDRPLCCGRTYISFGQLEGRLTNLFNAESYLNNYADLKSAFANDHTIAKKHYVESGFNEGRLF